MELKEFVETVLTDIFVGVANAQSKISDNGGVINPNIAEGTSGVIVAPTHKGCSTHKRLCVAEFDVALTVSDKKDEKAKIGVLLCNIGAGVGVKSSAETSQITRVKFSVPYRLP